MRSSVTTGPSAKRRRPRSDAVVGDHPLRGRSRRPCDRRHRRLRGAVRLPVAACRHRVGASRTGAPAGRPRQPGRGARARDRALPRQRAWIPRRSWVLVPLAIIVVVLGIVGAVLTPRERRLAAMADGDPLRPGSSVSSWGRGSRARRSSRWLPSSWSRSWAEAGGYLSRIGAARRCAPLRRVPQTAIGLLDRAAHQRIHHDRAPARAAVRRAPRCSTRGHWRARRPRRGGCDRAATGRAWQKQQRRSRWPRTFRNSSSST